MKMQSRVSGPAFQGITVYRGPLKKIKPLLEQLNEADASKMPAVWRGTGVMLDGPDAADCMKVCFGIETIPEELAGKPPAETQVLLTEKYLALFQQMKEAFTDTMLAVLKVQAYCKEALKRGTDLNGHPIQEEKI